jgi:hypothetical protein
VATTNAIFLTNVFQTNLLRPDTLEVTRGTPFEWFLAGPTNAVFTPDLVDNPGYATPVVTNNYAAYAVDVGFLNTFGTTIPGIINNLYRVTRQRASTVHKLAKFSSLCL